MINAKERTIAIIDEHSIYRKGLRQWIAMSNKLTLVGEADNYKSGISICQEFLPDIVLLDLNIRDPNDLANTVKAIKELNYAPLVIILTASDHLPNMLAAFSAGADGYLLKDIEPEDLLEKLYRISPGIKILSPSLDNDLNQLLREVKSINHAKQYDLSERQMQILKLVVIGRCNKEIGQALNITEDTVKTHVKRILTKINLHSRYELSAWFYTKHQEACEL